MPKPSDEDIERTTDYVLARINKRVLSKQALVDRSGLSFKTVDRLIEQRVLPTFRDKRKQLSRGLGWHDDAIERLLAGEDPATFPDIDHAESQDAPPWEAILTGQREISDRLERLAALLERDD